ncbi:hypothetical protein [Anaerovorax sp. IOR16]|uniref:hypothetical protein n=1 Tax=Anaerovorax sp. IOR16 TaxID=2773458 RepID=UPI0019D219CC|nr:hypothetical protein [Anaerovorax sp. IOR16]
MEFTFGAYGKLIECLREYGYCFADYLNYKNYDKSVILRHDVDMDLQKAVEMAKFEFDLGVSSTYYVLITSDFYNVFSKNNQKHLQEIIGFGHTVGLHFDEAKYGQETDIVEAIEEEAALLAQCIGTEVTTVSMHRPSSKTLEANYKINGGKIVNSYGTEFFKNFKYVSDSRRNWRENVFEMAKSGEHSKLHILTHPIWYDINETSMKECLKEFVSRASIERYETLVDNIRDLNEVLNRPDI